MTNIKILQEAIENDKLTIFIGAGVSMGAGLPSWEELIDEMKKDLNTAEKDYLKIAEEYFNKFGKEKYCDLIQKNIPDKVDDFNKKDAVHKLIFDLKPKNVITTNYDMLLEDTTERYGYVYDVISTDEHLVDTNLPNHIIKMHGEFKTNNIVLKQSDYDKYTEDFPLIENYIKSILSTNTILFLGYGYGDSTLHNIVKWLRDASDKYPPMFLTTFKEDKEQMEKLKESGIDTIILENYNEKYKKLDKYSNKVATFLHGLINPLDIYIDNFSDKDIVDFIYFKMKPLDELDSILLKQIQSTLTNCGFSYQQFTYKTGEIKNLVFLEFYDTILTGDINKNIRNVYNKFRQILNNFSDDYSNEIKEKINFIVSILYKANIDGYIKTDDKNSLHKTMSEFGFFTTLKINDTEKSLCNFDFNDFEVNQNDIKTLMKKAFLYYQKYEFLEAYTLNKKIIELCLKEQNYVQLFLSMFNQNVLLNNLKSSLHNIGAEKEYKTANEAWQYQIKPYNLDEKFYDLPKPIQAILKDIKPFVSYDYLYKFSSQIEDELDTKLKQKRNLEQNQSRTWDTNVTRNYSKHKNFISFVLNNYMMIERNIDFTTINKKLIKISLIRQMKHEHIMLDKMELFSLIKYVKYKELIELFNDFISDDSKLKISIQNINWMVNKLLPNIFDLFNQNKSLYSLFSNELKNVIYLLQTQQLSEFQSKRVLQKCKELINGNKIDLDMYKSINNFIGNQDKMNNNELIDILEMMINKIIDYRSLRWDNHVIEYNYFYNPFKYLSEQKFIYENKALIEKFLKELEKYEEKGKIEISKGFLINLYYISNDAIKEIIKNFMININIDNVPESKLSNIDITDTQNFNFSAINNYGLKISFKLFLIIEKLIDITPALIDEIKLYPERDEGNTQFLGEITGQVRYLVEQLDISELEELLTNLLKIIDDIQQKEEDRNRMRNMI